MESLGHWQLTDPFLFFFLQHWGFEFRALCLLGRTLLFEPHLQIHGPFLNGLGLTSLERTLWRGRAWNTLSEPLFSAISTPMRTHLPM
jgi:hypothetical protein